MLISLTNSLCCFSYLKILLKIRTPRINRESIISNVNIVFCFLFFFTERYNLNTLEYNGNEECVGTFPRLEKGFLNFLL